MSENPTPEALREPVLAAILACRKNHGHLSSHKGPEACPAVERAISLYGLQMRAAGLREAECAFGDVDGSGNSWNCATTWPAPEERYGWCNTCRLLAEVERQIQEAAHG